MDDWHRRAHERMKEGGPANDPGRRGWPAHCGDRGGLPASRWLCRRRHRQWRRCADARPRASAGADRARSEAAADGRARPV